MKELSVLILLSLMSFSSFAEPPGSCSTDLSQCYQDNRNLQNQLMYTQNQLYQCQNGNKKWNCSYSCGGNYGVGSDGDKSAACKKAKSDAHAICGGVQCECSYE